MLTNNLRCFVALDPFRSYIPRRNVAIRVQQKQGVILNAVHEKLKAVFLLKAGGLRSLLLRKIFRDFSEPYQLARTIVDCRDRDRRPEFAPVLSDTPTLILNPSFAGGYL